MPLENQTTLTLDNGRFTLTHPGRRPRDWDFTPRDRQRFDGFVDAYREALGKRDRVMPLLRIGRDIRDWLGDRLGDPPRPPWHFVVQTSRRPDDDQRAFLAVPWELIADRDGHWVAQPHLRFNPYRHLGLPSLDETQIPPSDYRLSVLFMAAAPRNQSVLDFEGEEMAILSALGDTAMDLAVEESGMLSLLASHANRFSEIRTPDGRSEQAAVAVIHLSCHGGFSSHGEPGLYLEDETGTPVFTRAEDFRRYPNLSHGGLLFLSACHTAEGQPSGKGPHDRVIDSLSQDLLLSGFRAVLGWDGAVGDEEAAVFAAELYRNLARKEDLAGAVGAARHQLFFRRDRQGNPLASRDWHLARLFLGMDGGGPLTRGSQPRRSLDSQHGIREFLDAKRQAVPVATRAEFVGRRRPIQRVLRAFREREGSGVLIHGMGRQGKSSLAARVASRLSDLQPVVVFGRYRGQDVLRAFADAALGQAVNDWVRAHEPAVRQDPARMNDAIQELLRGPLRKQPVLLILDDLERILAPSAQGLHRVEGEPERETLAALIRGFKAVPGDSRLLITARYRFILPDDGGRDLTEALLSLPLPPMDAGEQQKQLRKRRLLLEEAKEEDAIHPEAPQRTERCLAVAQGNPGLQDLLYRLSRREPAACDRTLDSLEDWLRGRSLAVDDKGAEEIRNLLEGLVLAEIGKALTDGERALLGASGLFALPVPERVMARLMDAKSPDDGFQSRAERLVALGLWDVWPDPVHPRQSALAINPLARSLAPAPDDSDAGQWAGRCIETLAEAWMPAPAEPPDQSQANRELTRLALLARHIPVIETCAGKAVAWLYDNLCYREAAAMGRWALEQLQQAGVRPPLGLLRWGADALARIGDTPAAREWYWLALDLYREEKNTFDYATLLVSHARSLVNDGEQDKAMESLIKAQGFLNRQDHPRDHAITLGEIARIKGDQGQIAEALELYQEELSVFEQLGDQRGRAITLGDIGVIHLHQREPDRARSLYEEKWEIAKGLGDVGMIAHARWFLGNIANTQQDIQGALEHLNAAYQMFVKLERLDGIAMVGWDLGLLLCQFGISRDNEESKKSGRTILTRSRDALRQFGRTEQAEQVAVLLRECGGERYGDGHGPKRPEPAPSSLARRVLDKIKRHH
uniref:Tetratricopeptide repeat-containing protein n=1 Tax=Candidatus Kentrum sp. FW TaxID=2126338 RepID=A0A450TJW4_9GAMM|nr:MAG: Tetratricopeptide repeat-containing protein [Candidatus Kentron sp. FW]